MNKPSKETIAKHVAILEGVAARKRNHGVLPNYTWLNKNNFFRSYEVMRAAPAAFKHIPRATRKAAKRAKNG